MASNHARTMTNLPFSNVGIWLRIPMAFTEPKEHSLNNCQKNKSLFDEKNDSHTEIKKSNMIDLNIKKRKINQTNSITNETVVGNTILGNLISETTVSADSIFIENTVSDSFTLWDNFRHISNSDRRVYIALEFSSEKDLNVCTTGTVM